METRILKSDEYHLLDSIPESDAIKLHPDNTWVAAVFDEGRIIGRLVAISLPHIEGAWIDPTERNGLVAFRLHSALTRKLEQLGAKTVIAFAVNNEMESYLQRLGYRQFATAWRKELSCLGQP